MSDQTIYGKKDKSGAVLFGGNAAQVARLKDAARRKRLQARKVSAMEAVLYELLEEVKDERKKTRLRALLQAAATLPPSVKARPR